MTAVDENGQQPLAPARPAVPAHPPAGAERFRREAPGAAPVGVASAFLLEEQP